MKKAQTEIIGLAIVVVLVVVGMTFVIGFYINKEPTEIKTTVSDTQLASNSVNTFLKTTSRNCNELSMTELIQDCAQGQSITCDQTDSCAYVNGAALEIFDKIIGPTNTQYYFSVTLKDETTPIQAGSVCLGNRRSKEFPIPTGSGTVLVRMDICR